jgi:hypothetical protein
MEVAGKRKLTRSVSDAHSSYGEQNLVLRSICELIAIS